MSNAPNLSSSQNLREFMVTTTDATATTLDTIFIEPYTVCTIKSYIAARRTGGTSGTDGDSAGYSLEATYKNVSGTATIIGYRTKIENEDQSAWDCEFTVSGPNILLQVTGASGNNVTWSSSTTVIKAV
jgi:hypothetical protein